MGAGTEPAFTDALLLLVGGLVGTTAAAVGLWVAARRLLT